MPIPTLRTVGIASLLLVAGCGAYVPQMEEAWEEVELPRTLEYRIKDHLFCELVRSLKYAHENITINGLPVIPDTYGVQMQVTLTVEENTALSPGLNFTRTLRNVVQSGVSVGQNTNVGLGANLSSTATRTDTSYSYYNVGRIAGPGKNSHCDKPEAQHGSSLLLHSSLGIKDFLASVALPERFFKSSRSPSLNKSAMIDIYSYDVKFAIVSNGSVNPSWKLVDLSANVGSNPLFSAGRKRTHQLVLTFGPGENEPTPSSVQTHFTTQIVRSLDALRQGP